MSIQVDLEALAAVLGEFRHGYLVTTRDGRAKAVTVEPELVDGVLHAQPSAGSAVNIAANDKVTLIYPPTQYRGHTLIIDATATVTGPDAAILVTPTAAVLHRPARHADGPPPPQGCANDCRPLGEH